MCDTAQTGNARPAHDLIVHLRSQRCQATTMKHALKMEIVKVVSLCHVRGEPDLPGPLQDSARIQGGNRIQT